MDEMSYEHILYEVTDGVAAITFNLPQYANAMDFQGVRETFDALMRAEGDDDVGPGTSHPPGASGSVFSTDPWRAGMSRRTTPDFDFDL